MPRLPLLDLLQAEGSICRVPGDYVEPRLARIFAAQVWFEAERAARLERRRGDAPSARATATTQVPG
jgi:hypothetical protein